MDNTLKQIETLIIELNKSYKALQFYPDGHPALRAANKRTIDCILALLKEREQISFSILRTGFEYEGEKILKDSKEYFLLSQEFFLRNISKIIFTKTVTIEELIAFSKILTDDAKEIRSKGGIETVMMDHNIKGIWSNEVNYAKLLERQKKKKEEEASTVREFDESDFEGYIKEEKKEEVKEETFEEEVAEGTNEDEKNALAEIKEVFVSDKELFKLLRALLKEKNADAYSDKLNKIVNVCHHFNNGKEYNIVLKVSFFLLKLIQNDAPPFPEHKTLVTTKLREIVITEVITLAIGSMLTDTNKEKYRFFFLTVGKMCIPVLLDFLSKKGDINTRNNISDTLAEYKESGFDEIKPWLDDRRWHVVCGAVSAIGKVGSDLGLAILIPELENEDIRVQKEVIKAIGKIGGVDSYEIMQSLVKTRKKDLLIPAILALGKIKCDLAIPCLIKLTKKGIFIKNDIEVRKTAVTALGNLGFSEAIQHLLRVVKHKSFFGGRDSDELRIVAISAIGKIGGEEAIQALEIGVNLQNPIIRNECKAMLEKVVNKMNKNEEDDISDA